MGKKRHSVRVSVRRKNALHRNDVEHYQEDGMNKADLIHLMAVYEAERAHRDSMGWARTMKFFYATLIVIFIPNFYFIQLQSPCLNRVFPVIGFFMAAFFMLVTIAGNKRIKNFWNVYKRISEEFPEWCQVEQINGFWGMSLNHLVSAVMFGVLMLLSIIMLCFDNSIVFNAWM